MSDDHMATTGDTDPDDCATDRTGDGRDEVYGIEARYDCAGLIKGRVLFLHSNSTGMLRAIRNGTNGGNLPTRLRPVHHSRDIPDKRHR